MEELKIIGGTYLERCIDPNYSELFGSGLRGAIALSNKGLDIVFHTGVGKDYLELLKYKSRLFGFGISITETSETVFFDYYHPLSKPVSNNLPKESFSLGFTGEKNVLFYGMIEAVVNVESEYLVYDPQNHVPFRATGSRAEHLALILNKNEALMFFDGEYSDLREVGSKLMFQQGAEVVVIKNGSNGALVFEKNEIIEVPVFETQQVWPIGSGDVFSATFAYHWMMLKSSAAEAALLASQTVAQFCETQQLPIIESVKTYNPISPSVETKRVYLAGPFFTMAERFFISEVRDLLLDFGNDVFSPFHDAVIADAPISVEQATKIAGQDLNAILHADIVLAVLSGMDPGTLFEIGFARANGKKVVVLCENEKEGDLLMLLGSGCQITGDLSTAIYKSSW